MKFLNLLAFCCAIASSAIIPSSPGKPSNTTVHVCLSNTSSVASSSLDPTKHHELLSRADNQAYAEAQRAAGSRTLKSGKYYYFMNCYVAKSTPGPQGEAAQIWVQKQTKSDTLPHGCSHVGLVVGQVENEVSGCFFGCKKRFTGHFLHVHLFGLGKKAVWVQSSPEYKTKVPEQRLIWGGETLKSKVNIDALLSAGEKWIAANDKRFDVSANCLTYYQHLANLL